MNKQHFTGINAFVILTNVCILILSESHGTWTSVEKELVDTKFSVKNFDWITITGNVSAVPTLTLPVLLKVITWWCCFIGTVLNSTQQKWFHFVFIFDTVLSNQLAGISQLELWILWYVNLYDIIWSNMIKFSIVLLEFLYTCSFSRPSFFEGQVPCN